MINNIQKIFILLFGISSCLTFSFSTFAINYHKSYQQSEYFQREVYYSTLAAKAAQLALNVSYQIGQNQYWDSSDEQKIKLARSVNRLDINADNFDTYINTKSHRLRQALEIDWRDNNAVTPVRNQGRDGVAWAFVTVAQIQSFQLQYELLYDFSESQLISCTKDSGIESGYIEFALQRVTTEGISQENESPSDMNLQNQSLCIPFQSHTIFSHFYRFQNLTNQKLQKLLAQGPIITKVSAQNWIYYKSGIMTCDPDSQIRHAILLIGFTQTYWIGKNSWGMTWGEDGYIKISRKYLENCGVGSEVYVLMEMGYEKTILTLLVFVIIFVNLL